MIAFSTNKSENFIAKKEYEILFHPKVQALIDNTLLDDDGVYRFNNHIASSFNMNKIYGLNYYSTSLYSSTYHADYSYFVHQIMKNPMPYRNYLMLGQSRNIFFETLMGIRYIVATNQPDIGYEQVKSADSISVYKNDFVFPIGYANSNVLSVHDFEQIGYPYNLEYLLNTIVVGDSSNSNYQSHMHQIELDYDVKISDSIDVMKTDEGYSIDSSGTNEMIFSLKKPLEGQILVISFDGLKPMDCQIGDLDITINGITNKLTCDWLYYNQNDHFSYVLSADVIDTLTVVFSNGHFDIENIQIYSLDAQYVKESVNKINPFVIDVQKTVGDIIEGTIDVTDLGYFATTIPYDEGFTIYVDGVITEYEKVNQAFIGFPIEKGSHVIRIVYKSPWRKMGFISTIFGGILFMIEQIIQRRKFKNI